MIQKTVIRVKYCHKKILKNNEKSCQTWLALYICSGIVVALTGKTGNNASPGNKKQEGERT